MIYSELHNSYSFDVHLGINAMPVFVILLKSVYGVVRPEYLLHLCVVSLLSNRF
jgi:hypothetical protein